MKNIRLILKLQNRIFLNWLRREFAAKTLVEIGFGIFLLGATAVRFHQDIGFVWIHASPKEVAAVVQNSLFGIFFLATFFFQLAAMKAIRIPSGDALLSLPLRDKDIYFFRANAFLIQLLPWFLTAVFFWAIGWLRFTGISTATHLLQIIGIGFLLVNLSQLTWAIVMLFQLFFLKVFPILRAIVFAGAEILLFIILALFRQSVLPVFHPEFRFDFFILVAVVLGAVFFFQINYFLFREILNHELHLQKNQSQRPKLIPKFTPVFPKILPPPLKSLIQLTIRAQFRTNPFVTGIILTFGIFLLIGFEISHTATDFLDNTLFGILILYIVLSAAFFGNQKEVQQKITFYKSQPIPFANIWWGHFVGILLIYETLTIAYFAALFIFFGSLSIPLWALNLLVLFPVFLGILQTNFYLTLLQNVKTGEYLYVAFWAINWVFWFVFPFLPMFFLLAGTFAVKPARTLFEQVEESW